MNLKKGGGVAEVVTNEALRGDTDLIFVNGRFRLRLLHLLVSIHFPSNPKNPSERERAKQRERGGEILWVRNVEMKWEYITTGQSKTEGKREGLRI